MEIDFRTPREAIMRAAGLVKTRRQAQQIFYSVQDEKTAATAAMLLKW